MHYFLHEIIILFVLLDDGAYLYFCHFPFLKAPTSLFIIENEFFYANRYNNRTSRTASKPF